MPCAVCALTTAWCLGPHVHMQAQALLYPGPQPLCLSGLCAHCWCLGLCWPVYVHTLSYPQVASKYTHHPKHYY